jgi:hypothetical protein
VIRVVVGLLCLLGCGRLAFDERPLDAGTDADPSCGPVAVAKVAAGRGFSCALRTDGTVACW